MKYKKDTLTEIELQVLRLICEDKKHDEIADIVFRSIPAVDCVVSRIKLKSKCRTKGGIVVWAIRMGHYEI